MFKSLFSNNKLTTKTDVVLAFAGLIIATIKATDTLHTFREQNKEIK